MNRIISTVILCAVLAAVSLCNTAAEGAADAAGLIEKAKLYIEEGSKEEAIAALDTAFGLADSVGDQGAHISIDPSLKTKAMEAWTAAGRWKCR
jgi:hypothetical protein